MTDCIEMHAIVKGRVQGVGFRATVRFYALQLDLKGTVRNLSDGSVEIYAQGSRQKLDDLIARIKQNDGLIVVESIAVDYYEPVNMYDRFQ